MNFYYKSSNGVIIDFNSFPYFMQDNRLTDYSWSYTAVEGKNKIKNVNQGVGERTFTLAIIPDFNLPAQERKRLVKAYVDRLFSVFDYDVVKGVDGRMYTDTGYYLPCRVVKSSKSLVKPGLSIAKIDFNAVSQSNKWVQEVSKTFLAGKTDNNAANQDYPYDYKYDYASNVNGIAKWNINHFDKCDAEIVIYGGVVNPQIIINSHKYAVYTTVSADERLVINTKNNQCYKISNIGQVVNCFDLRGKEQSVFEKLPAEPMTISWNGAFRFDITAFIERSEPEWS